MNNSTKRIQNGLLNCKAQQKQKKELQLLEAPFDLYTPINII
jgi:hypothetical protein